MAQALPEDVEGISNFLKLMQDMNDDSTEPSVQHVKQQQPEPEKMVRIYDEYGAWSDVPASLIGDQPLAYSEDDLNSKMLQIESEPRPQNNKTMQSYNDPYANDYIEDKAQVVSRKVSQDYSGKEWVMKEGKHEKYNTIKVYSICSAFSGKPVLQDIMMYESAATILNLMNSGKVLSDPKVLGIIASGIEYGTVLREGISYAEKRGAALQKKDYQSAMQIDEDIERTKAKAGTLKESVLKYLKDEGYIE